MSGNVLLLLLGIVLMVILSMAAGFIFGCLACLVLGQPSHKPKPEEISIQKEEIQMPQDLPATKEEILVRLREKPWFQASRMLVKTTIENLPNKFTGYLEDLVGRPDGMLGDLDVQWINHVYPTNFGIATLFAVRSPEGNEYEYEYFSWGRGPLSGAKGVVRILDDANNVTHLAILRGMKFATGKEEFDIPGGFREGVETDPSGVLQRFIIELQEELGLKEPPTILKVHKLGRLRIDAGMTNNWPYIFCADIPASEQAQIGEVSNPDEWELSDIGPFIVPISQLPKLISSNDDSYFLSVVARMIPLGLIPLSLFADA